MVIRKYVPNEYTPENKDKISRIVQIEWEITTAIREGHKSFYGDKFKEKREEAIRLRREIGVYIY